MIEKLRKLFERNHIKMNSGMSAQEIEDVEQYYKIEFPMQYREMLNHFVPVQNGFYDWSDNSEKNVCKIKEMLEWPFEGIIFDITENEFWMNCFGKMPTKMEDRVKVFLEYKNHIPKLIPLIGHRYMVSEKENNYPVISVYQTDIIYYGGNLLEFFQNEIEKSFEVHVKKEIPFWSDIIENRRILL